MYNTENVSRAEAPSAILNRIKNIYDERGMCIVAIDGNSGAGKSTLAAHIAAASHASLIHMDDFFLPTELRTEERLDTPGGNVDYVRFQKEVINGISSGKSFNYNAYACANGEYSVKKVKCSPIYIIEGVYSLHPIWQSAIDLKVFMRVDYETQLNRILGRSGAEKLDDFKNKWIPMENKYFDFYNIESLCDITVFS